jgi:hypothetical protein
VAAHLRVTGLRAISKNLAAAAIGMVFGVGAIAETDFSTVEMAALDPALETEGWVLLKKRGVLATMFIQDAPDQIRIEANQSNALIYREVNDDHVQRPVLSWSWRTDSATDRAEIESAVNEDWPVAVYAAFKVDKQYVGLWRRFVNKIVYGVAGLPDSGKILTYVWSLDTPAGQRYPNPYIPKVGVINVLQSGDVGRNDWARERRDLLADFATAFGHPAERVLYLAISADSEDTGSHSVARVRDLQLVE